MARSHIICTVHLRVPGSETGYIVLEFELFDILGKKMLEWISNIKFDHMIFLTHCIYYGGLEAMWSGNKLQFDRRVTTSLNKSSF